MEVRPADELHKLRVLPEFSVTPEFQALAVAFKRAKNISRDASPALRPHPVTDSYFESLKEPAERALFEEIETRRPVIERAAKEGQGFREAFAEAARFKPVVDQFFEKVLVNAPDQQLREKRLALVSRLVSLILELADISEIVAEESKQA
jgi:glycyl-tRNA synthetase beta chain